MTVSRCSVQTARRILAAGVAVCLLAGPLGIGHIGREGDDLACAPPSTRHDSAAHRIVAADAGLPAADEHCYLCHWLRSLRSPLATSQFLGAPPAETATTHTGTPTGIRQLSITPLASRAPPASV